MAQLSVRQAALQVGISRQTLFRKIKEGTVSATVGPDGHLQVDTAELLRVFGALQPATDSPTTLSDRTRPSHGTADSLASVAQQIEIERLKAQLELKTAELAMTRERLLEVQDRERLAREERDRMFGLLEQQTRLLAAPPTPVQAPVPATPSPRRKKSSKKGSSTKSAKKTAAEPEPAPTPGQASGGGLFWPWFGGRG